MSSPRARVASPRAVRTALLMLMIAGAWTTASAQSPAGYDAFLAGKYCEAREYWLKDWQGSNATAAFGLAELYARGLCIDKNDTLASRWYLRAALAGSARGRSEIGIRYAYGKGVAQNYYKAYVWLRVARLTASPWERDLAESAQRNIDTLAVRLTGQELRSADATADEFSRTYKLPALFSALD